MYKIFLFNRLSWAAFVWWRLLLQGKGETSRRNFKTFKGQDRNLKTSTSLLPSGAWWRRNKRTIQSTTISKRHLGSINSREYLKSTPLIHRTRWPYFSRRAPMGLRSGSTLRMGSLETTPSPQCLEFWIHIQNTFRKLLKRKSSITKLCLIWISLKMAFSKRCWLMII